VIQLALVLALGLISLALALAIGRVEVKRGAVAPTVQRIEGAVERAAVALLRVAAGRTLLLLVVPAAGLVACSLLLATTAGSVSAGGRAVFFCVSLLGGALSALGQARLAVALGTRASSAAAAAAVQGSSRSLRPLMRAAGALAVFGEGAGLLGVAATFASLYAVRGGFASPAGNLQLALEVVGLLPAFALGAAVTALAISREGSVLAAAVGVGASHASEREARLEPQDPRSPATLADVLGRQAGGFVPRVLSSYVCGVTATVSVALLAVAGGPANGAPGSGALTCISLVLIVRAFGVIGSACGIFAARAAEGEAPGRALLRGHACAVLVSAFGLGAALFWLRVDGFLMLLWPGLAGLLSTALVAQLAWLPLRRSGSSAREVAEARSVGSGATIARGAGVGLSSLLPALLLPALALALAESVQADPGGYGPGSALVLAAFVAGVLATMPFSLAVAGFGLLCDAAHEVATLARLDGDARRRGSRLEEAGVVGLAAASTHASVGLATSLLLGLFTLAEVSALPSQLPRGVALSVVIAGAALVLTFAARCSRSAVLGAREVAEEIERQLRGFPRRQGAVELPPDFTPSYKACIDTALGAARRSSILESASPLLVPFLVTGILVASHGVRPKSALLAFAGAALLCGLPLVLGGRATHAALSELRRRSRASDATGSSSTVVSAHSFGELIGLTTATSVEALVCALTLSVLCIAPLLG